MLCIADPAVYWASPGLPRHFSCECCHQKIAAGQSENTIPLMTLVSLGPTSSLCHLAILQILGDSNHIIPSLLFSQLNIKTFINPILYGMFPNLKSVHPTNICWVPTLCQLLCYILLVPRCIKHRIWLQRPSIPHPSLLISPVYFCPEQEVWLRKSALCLAFWLWQCTANLAEYPNSHNPC